MLVFTDLTIDIAHYILKKNNDIKQKSFYLGNDYLSLKIMIDEGYLTIVNQEDKFISSACLIKTDDNSKLLYLVGPYGETKELREEMLHFVKEKYFQYEIKILTDARNDLLNLFTFDAEKISMEKVNDKFIKVDHVYVVSSKEEINDVIENNANNLVLAYRENNILKGYLVFDKENLFINDIHVLEENNFKQIATSLLNYLFSLIGINELIRVNVIDREDFFKNAGFRVSGKVILASMK